MTTRSAPHSLAARATSTGSAAFTASGSATSRVPALPGAQASPFTAGSEDRATHRACSRAPEPITSTRTTGDATEPATHCTGRPSGARAERARERTCSSPTLTSSGRVPGAGQAGGVLLHARPVDLLALGAESGPQARTLLRSCAGVDSEQLAVRLGLQLAPGGEPGGIQPAVVDGRGDRAAGFTRVGAVAEPARRRQPGDVGVGGVHPVD